MSRPHPLERTKFQWLAHAYPPHVNRFLGGGRGGGKSVFFAQDILFQAVEWKSEASILFLRQGPYKALTDSIKTLRMIFNTRWSPGSHSLNQSTYLWENPVGAHIEMGILPDGDAGMQYYEKTYQGRSFCAGVGTGIRMADGSLKPIEKIRTGEMVATLEGPRRVNGVTSPYEADCVRATVEFDGVEVGTQIQPVSHPLLSTSGLIERPSRSRRQSDRQPPVETSAPGASGQSRIGARRDIEGWVAFRGDDPSSGRASGRDIPGERQPAESSFPVVLHAPTLRSRVDAEAPSRTALSDAWDRIRRCTRARFDRWRHPYTGEERSLSEEVLEGMVRLEPCGRHLVADLTVEHASHYISSTGLVNKNTHIYIDEAQQWSTPTVLDLLLSSLRHPSMPVRATMGANPGGRGHQWIVQRFINTGVPDWEPYDIEVELPAIGTDAPRKMRKRWVSCPSTYRDNPFLGDDYLANLAAACHHDDELLKAWINGNWNIARGAYFSAVLDERRNKVNWPAMRFWLDNHPFDPEEWRWWLGYDHGTAAPAVAYVVAESPGSLGPDDKFYPYGSIVLVDEYASNLPGNYSRGRGLTVRQLAEPIKQLAQRWDIPASGSCDPACFQQHGHTDGTIADEYRKNKIFWRPANTPNRAPRFTTLKEMIANAGSEELAGLYVDERCVYWWNTVPFVVHDDRDREVPLKCATDHGLDASTYGVWGGSRIGGSFDTV